MTAVLSEPARAAAEAAIPAGKIGHARMLRRRWLFWQGSRPGILPGRSFALTAEWECEVCNGHKKKRRVVITGLGTVNPTGNTVAESWANIKAGRCAVGPITAFDTADFKVKLAAEVKDFDPAARIDKREARKMARFTQFAVAAADEAVRDSALRWKKSTIRGLV